MVYWFTVVTDRDDNSGLALLFASEPPFSGFDFIEAIFNLTPVAFGAPLKVLHPQRPGRWHRARLAAYRLR